MDKRIPVGGDQFLAGFVGIATAHPGIVPYLPYFSRRNLLFEQRVEQQSPRPTGKRVRGNASA
jgi:hypothetical protein